MTAKEAPIGEWIMIKHSKRWFKKQADGESSIEATQAGSKKIYHIQNNEEVEVRK